MTDINTVTIIGRLTRDADVKQIPSGTEVASLSVAVNRSIKRGDQWSEEASFFDVEKWKPGGLAQYLTKGQQVAVTGELIQDRWEHDGQKRSKVKIHAQSIQLLGSRSQGNTSPGDTGEVERYTPTEGGSGAGFEDDIPF